MVRVLTEAINVFGKNADPLVLKGRRMALAVETDQGQSWRRRLTDSVRTIDGDHIVGSRSRSHGPSATVKGYREQSPFFERI